jgi:succinate dehydrogenase / fumarate reductase membrane anchor subunit
MGYKKQAVGAGYGFRDWLAQRVTAVVMAIYTLILLVVFFSTGEFTYEAWAGVFAGQFMKVATLLALLSLFYHAWVGIRDLWMDYIKPNGVRLVLHVLTILYLLGCAAYAAQILWRV